MPELSKTTNDQAKFHSANGKRLVLIVDDEFVNRELIKVVLQEEYELIEAEDGASALEQMRANKDILSLVLLDLSMPVMDGIEVLGRAKADPEIAHIPIIVLTANQDAEVESLTLGANDFIPKPYPQPDVIMARVLKTIELSEDRQIISSTERDILTGLYNREFFYRYAEQYDHHHKDKPMDAIVVDVNHFHMINERFGTTHGDEVIARIGKALRAEVIGEGGMVCRREADIFLVYCPHGLEYAKLLENATMRASGDIDGSGALSPDIHLWLRMGVYENVDKSMEIERRFDRAKMAADKVKGSFAVQIGVYDNELHEKELYHEQLIDGFDAAIKNHQFKVYFQPKFDVKPAIPVLASAEALVRWEHPTLGMVSPGEFVPLFEENGLIQGLDTFVWRETAMRIREWKERFDFAVPVSVNVSRIDMYDPHLVDTLREILVENGLTPHDLLLEITESAYTQESDQIIATVNKLRRLGFKVEMDDFGTGYSSLNMISTLPIDALKVDMGFIRNAFSENGDTKMLEVVIDIAEYLSIPVIAEGVETREQMEALKGMGCDFVQGYYFSRPVPAGEYEKFVIERKKIADEQAVQAVTEEVYGTSFSVAPYEGIADALSAGFERIYYVDTESDHYVEFGAEGELDDLQIESSGCDFFGGKVSRIVNEVCPEDAIRVELSLRKEALLSQLESATPFFITFRVMQMGVPVFYNLEAAWARTHEAHHLVIGTRNIDAQIRDADAEGLLHELNYSSFSRALASDLECIYYVDADTGAYEQFEVDGPHGEFVRVGGGSDFFTMCAETLDRIPLEGGQGALDVFGDRRKLIDKLSKYPAFIVFGLRACEASPGPLALKAVWADGSNRRHIVIGTVGFVPEHQ